MMKTVFAAAVATLMATSVMAGGLSDIRPEPRPVAFAVQDWTGAYAGVSVGRAFTNAGDDNFVGAFAGYRHDFGAYVLGAEADYRDNRNGVKAYSLKTQAGYDAGAFLPYATLGVQKVENLKSEAVYGLGIDYKITDRYTVGAEWLKNHDTKADQVTVKAAYRF